MSWFEINSKNYDQKTPNHYKSTKFYEKLIIESNWKVLCVCFINKKLKEKIFLKIYIRKILFINFLNIPDGFNKSYPKSVYAELILFLKKKFFGIYILLINNNECKDLTFNNFKYLKFSTIDNLYKTLPLDERSLLSSYSKNWRHNYKRSMKKNLNVKINNSPNKEEIINLSNKFHKLKNKKIYSNFTKDLFSYLKYFKDNIFHFECRLDNKLLAVRTVLVIKNKSWDLFALSDELARKNYANYHLMHKVFTYLIIKKVKYFDFCGVNYKSNKGVFNFKIGTGCYLLKTNHEFVYSNNIFIKYFFIIFLYIKRKNYV